MRARWVGVGALAALLAGLLLWNEEPEASRAETKRPGRSERVVEQSVERPASPESAEPEPPAAPGAAVSPSPSRRVGTSVVTVRAEDGMPIAGAVILMGGRMWVTGADGAANIGWSRESGAGFQVVHDDYLDVQYRGERREEIAIELRRGGEVTGRVEFPDGAPVPGHRVDAFITGFQTAATRTGPDGRFRLRGLPSGGFLLECQEAEPESITCRAGDRDVQFRMLQSVLRIALRSRDGRPVAGAELDSDVGVVHEAMPFPEQATTHSVLVPPGEDVTVQIERKGYRFEEIRVPAWSTRPALHEMTVTLAPAPPAALLLRVRGADGAIPPHVRVTAFVRTSAGNLAARRLSFLTMESELLRIDGLDEGAVALEVSAGNDHRILRRIEARAELDPQSVTEVRLPAAVHLFIHWTPARSGDELDVRAVDPPGGIAILRIGDRYRSTTRIAPGDYLVSAKRDGAVIREERITVPGPEDFEVDWSERD